jgi:hypothetical protein
VRNIGWILVVAGVLGVCLWVVGNALDTRTGDEFDRWVGWANIFALPAGGIGTALIIADRIRGSDPPTEDREPTQQIIGFGGVTGGVIGGDMIVREGVRREDDDSAVQ